MDTELSDVVESGQLGGACAGWVAPRDDDAAAWGARATPNPGPVRPLHAAPSRPDFYYHSVADDKTSPSHRRSMATLFLQNQVYIHLYMQGSIYPIARSAMQPGERYAMPSSLQNSLASSNVHKAPAAFHSTSAPASRPFAL